MHQKCPFTPFAATTLCCVLPGQCKMEVTSDSNNSITVHILSSSAIFLRTRGGPQGALRHRASLYGAARLVNEA